MKALWTTLLALGWLVAVVAGLVVVLGVASSGAGEGTNGVLALLALPWALGGAGLIALARHQLRRHALT